MREKINTEFVGFRLSKDQLRFIDENIRKENLKQRSQFIRKLIEHEMEKEKKGKQH